MTEAPPNLRAKIRSLARDAAALRALAATLPPAASAARRLAAIPCAGSGSRMGGLGYPKALHPIRGVPSLLRLMETLASSVSGFLLAVNDDPADLQKFRQALASRSVAWNVTYVPVSRPLGDGDAVLRLLRAVPRAFEGEVIVAWGDATVLDADLVTLSLRILNALDAEAPIVAPTVFEPEPYVALLRDAQGRICDVRYRRRGEVERDKEHDLSLFFCRYRPVLEALEEMAGGLYDPALAAYRCARGELSFLDLFKHLYSHSLETVAPCIGTTASVLSYNTQDEAESISRRLAGERGGGRELG